MLKKILIKSKNISFKVVKWAGCFFTFLLIVLILIFTLSSINFPKGLRLLEVEDDALSYSKNDLIILFKDDAYSKSRNIAYMEGSEARISKIIDYDLEEDDLVYLVSSSGSSPIRLKNNEISGEIKLKIPYLGRYLSFLDSIYGIIFLTGITLLLIITSEYTYLRNIINHWFQKKEKQEKVASITNKDYFHIFPKKKGKKKQNISNVSFIVKSIRRSVKNKIIGKKNIDSVVQKKF